MTTVTFTALRDGDREDCAVMPLIDPKAARTRTGASA
jgi:hypothetical protein